MAYRNHIVLSGASVGDIYQPTSSLLKSIQVQASSRNVLAIAMQPQGEYLLVHILLVYLNSIQVQTSSRNVLAVAMDLLGVHLLVVYLHSIQVQIDIGNVLAVAVDLVGVHLLVVYMNSTQVQAGSTKCTSSSNGPGRHVATRSLCKCYRNRV